MKSILFSFAILALVSFSSCEKEEANNINTELPAITSIDASNDRITAGADDFAILTCNATGGNLDYLWAVDLGDIIPLNESGSEVRYSGSSCCVGERIVYCTVSNDKGDATDNIIIYIN
jgi:hypothetical protein